MPNNYPWFKFDVAEWLTGEIVFETLSAQGLFTNICAIYWQRVGNLSIADIKKRYKDPVELKELTGRFLTVNSDGSVSIKFLDEQLAEKGVLSQKRAVSGSKGGSAKAAATPTVNGSEKKGKKFIPPDIGEVIEFFLSKGFTPELAKQAFDHYQLGSWKDAHGNPVVSWKQKMNTNWMKEENRVKPFKVPNVR